MSNNIQELSFGDEEEIDSTMDNKGKSKSHKASPKKPRVILTGKKRQRRLSSDVWVHFEFLDEPDENGNLICKCKKCGACFNGESNNGTGNLHRHVKNCKQRSFRDVHQMILEKTSSGLGNRLPEFDATYFRELLCLAIVEHDLPFQFVEYKGVRRLFSYLNPNFKPVSRNTIKSDVLKMHKKEKEQLKDVLASSFGRIALTSDCWTSITTDGYISLTAHYVDKFWCLQKKILNFSYITPPHTGIHLCDHVYGLLKEWGIQKNIFSITLDNASSNDVFAENLKGELDLICGGEFFHVRCCAHILNLVVQDGLKEIDGAVCKIRESVKYCKSSQARKQRFLSCVAHVELQSTRSLQQDVPTRWKSTYMMLDSALYFKKALIHFQKVDANYVHCPSTEEWGRVEKICKFLKVFHDVTLAFSGTKYPTSNLYFSNVLKVRLLLKNEMRSSDLFMQKMANKMLDKFGKYWADFSTFMVVAVVLDPRYKLQCVQWGYKRIYGVDVEFELEFSKVRDSIRELYNFYAASQSSSSNENLKSTYSEVVKESDDDIMKDFDDFSVEQSSVALKSEMDMYYEEPLMPRSSNIDILAYWRTCSARYPVLAQMAKDVLAVPVSTVASESAFSTGSWVLDCYRSSLKPETVESIICLRDWAFGEDSMDPQLEMLCGSIMKLEMEDKNDTPHTSPEFEKLESPFESSNVI